MAVTPGGALVRELQRDLLARMLHTEADERPEHGTLVRYATADGERVWTELPEPHPDDHRLAHIEREAAALVAEQEPVALGIATIVLGVPDPHETIAIWVVEEGGEALVMRIHTILLWDGLLVPGPVATLAETEEALGARLLAMLAG